QAPDVHAALGTALRHVRCPGCGDATGYRPLLPRLPLGGMALLPSLRLRGSGVRGDRRLFGASTAASTAATRDRRAPARGGGPPLGGDRPVDPTRVHVAGFDGVFVSAGIAVAGTT